MIIFFHQYLSDGKTYLEPSQISTMKLFWKKYFFAKPQQNTCTGVVFNKITRLYRATLLKERNFTQVLSHESIEMLNTPFVQNTSRQLLLLYRKIFYQQNRKEPSVIRKNENSL